MSRQVLFPRLKICTNVKNKYEKGNFELFLEEKIIRFEKLKKSWYDISLLVLVW
jgi:hypothetical protein